METFNTTGTDLTPQEWANIEEMFRPVSIAAIILTIFNLGASIIAIVLMLVDNWRIYKTWRISPSIRIPLSLVVVIFISHCIFVVKAAIGLTGGDMETPMETAPPVCKAMEELGFWAIWTPLVIMNTRLLVTIFSISFHFNSYGRWAEAGCIPLFLILSFIMYIPARVIDSPAQCAPFVLIFIGEAQTKLALAGTINLSLLLIILFMSILIVGFDTSMFKRDTSPAATESDNSAREYVRSQQKKNPDRKLIYYGIGLTLQYVLLLPNFVFGALGLINIQLNFLASVALHLDAVIVLLQYAFGHRCQYDDCRPSERNLHPTVEVDSFHRTYSSPADHWWRRSYIDSRSYITATRTPEAEDEKSATIHTVRTSLHTGPVSDQWPETRSTVAQEVPELPRLSIWMPGESRPESTTQDSLSLRLSRSTFRNLWVKSRLPISGYSPTALAHQNHVTELDRRHRLSHGGIALAPSRPSGDVSKESSKYYI